MNSTLESVVPLAMFFSEKNNVGVFWTDQVRKIYDKKYLTQRHGQKQRTLTEIQILRFDTQISTWKDFLVWGILIQINYENQLKMLGKGSNNQNGHLRWFFHQASDPPLMDIISRPFSTPLFSFAIESYIYMKQILHLVSVKNITFKSSHNWFKIDILRPSTVDRHN